jgi:AraC-like DNA-binding protein
MPAVLSPAAPAAKPPATGDEGARPGNVHDHRVERLTRSVAEVAKLARISEQLARDRISDRTLPALHVGGRWFVITRDADVLLGLERVAGDDGRAVLERAFRDRPTLRLAELAAAVGVSERSLQRLVARGELPTRGDGLLDAGRTRRWLLARYVPSRWQVERDRLAAGKRGAS